MYPIVLMLLQDLIVMHQIVSMSVLVESEKQWMHILHVKVILVPTVVEVMVRFKTGTLL